MFPCFHASCSVPGVLSGEPQEETSSEEAERKEDLGAAASGTDPTALGQATDRRQSQGVSDSDLLPLQGLRLQVLQVEGK